VSDNRQQLLDTINGLDAGGGTAFYDATLDAFQRVKAGKDSGRINAVVVLTDGEDQDSHLSASSVIQALGRQGESQQPIRVFTIAYSDGADAAQSALAKIATASGGKSYTGDTENIDSVYRSISSFF
jgi:Ca-activated chloride channel family protein